MNRKPNSKNLFWAVILCALVLVFGLGRQLSAASTASSPAAGGTCSINADCGGGAICVSNVCMRQARECSTNAECGGQSICSHDGFCY